MAEFKKNHVLVSFGKELTQRHALLGTDSMDLFWTWIPNKITDT